MNIHTFQDRGAVTEALKAWLGGVVEQCGYPRAEVFMSHGAAGTDFTHYLAVTLPLFRNQMAAWRARDDMRVHFTGLAKLARIEPVAADELGLLWVTRFAPGETDVAFRNTVPAMWAVNLYANLKAEVSR